MVKPVLVIPIPRESAVDATLASLLLHNRPNRARFVFSETDLYVVNHFNTVSRLKLNVKLSHFQFVHRTGFVGSVVRISNRNTIGRLLLHFYHHVIALLLHDLVNQPLPFGEPELRYRLQVQVLAHLHAGHRLAHRAVE